jgi:hypothetical protein
MNMPRRSVVLGMPISLALRGLNTLGIGSASIAKYAAPIATLSIATPWIAGMAKSVGSSSTTGIADDGVTAGFNILGSLLTFADLNAQVVTVTEKRRMAVVSIPGRESDYLQDLGGHSVKYRVSGKFFDDDPSYNRNIGILQTILQTTIGNGATGSTQLLRLIMRTATPIPFMCEHEIAMVVITDFKFSMIAGEPRWVNYDMELIEYTRIPYLAKMAMLGSSNLVSSIAKGLT